MLSSKANALKKYSINGETLSEEGLFNNDISYSARLNNTRVELEKSNAKTLARSCLLRISKKKYYRMGVEMA